MFKLKPQLKRKNNFKNSLVTNMVTNDSRPYKELKSEIGDLKDSLDAIKDINNAVSENLKTIANKVNGIEFDIDKIFAGTLDIVFLMPEVEIDAIYPNISNILEYGTEYHVNIVNNNDIGMNRENVVEKFIAYYNKGYRTFLTWSYSSILGELNEFFNNIAKTNPDINLDDVLLLDTYSTAVNLLKSNGEVTKRNQYCRRMFSNDALNINILEQQFNKNINDFDECVTIYVNDTYGAPLNVAFNQMAKDANVPYKTFPHTEINEGINYINNSNKRLYVIPIIFSDDLINLFTNIAHPDSRNENNKIKLSFSETLNFLPGVISNPDFLNKYRKYKSTFTQYVGASPSLPYLKDNLSPQVKGSTTAYLMIDSLNIMKQCNYFKQNGNVKLFDIYSKISQNYYGLSGLSKINETNFDRDTTMYLVALLSINTQLDDKNTNDPFPFIVSEYYTEYNGHITIVDSASESSFDEINKNLSKRNYFFTNWFNNDIKMEAKYIDKGETLSSTYGIGLITYEEKDITTINNNMKLASSSSDSSSSDSSSSDSSSSDSSSSDSSSSDSSSSGSSSSGSSSSGSSSSGSSSSGSSSSDSSSSGSSSSGSSSSGSSSSDSSSSDSSSSDSSSSGSSSSDSSSSGSSSSGSSSSGSSSSGSSSSGSSSTYIPIKVTTQKTLLPKLKARRSIY
jgi:hypothetical protein